jgi:hypothetical protein
VTTRSGPRSLLNYLVLPRAGDSVKLLIFPIGFALGALARGGVNGEQVIRATVIWFALEFLVYQARYQWNDIRGFEADQRHPDGDRGRLPGPVGRGRVHIWWSGVTAAGKVAVALVVAVGLGAKSGWTLLLAGIGVFAVAAVYEGLRSSSTGKTDVVPSPLTAGIVGIWIVVGAGYAIRALAGLSSAVDITTPPALAYVSAAACWMFGIAWVTSRWAVEATAFARREGNELVWAANSSDAREHQLALVHWLPETALDIDAPRDLATWRPVLSGVSLAAPWNVAAIAAGGLAAAAGGLLVAPGIALSWVLVATGAGAIATTGMILVGTRRERVLPLVSVATVVAAMWLGRGDLLVGVLPWFVHSAAQTFYLRQNRETLGDFALKLASLMPWASGPRATDQQRRARATR